MLNDQKLENLKKFIEGFTSEELIWINGFISGRLAAGSSGSAVTPANNSINTKLTLIYGTETGNAKALATKLAAEGKKNGLKIKLAPAETYKTKDFEKEENVIVVISTQGDGEPPLSAIKFYKALHDDALKLNNIKYGVLALGDSSYPLFCQAGIDVDAQLQLRGAERIFQLLKCDTDYETEATAWFQSAVSKLQNGQSQSVAPSSSSIKKVSTGKKIYSGKVNVNINLNDEGSNKETHHIEIEAEDLEYTPGDAIGIVPHNSDAVIEEILSFENGALQDTTVTWREQQLSIKDLLKYKAQIYYLPERVVKKYSEIVEQAIPETRIDLLDLLKIYPTPNKEAFIKVIEALEPITPRLYSISSSLESVPDEVHITVAIDKFKVNDEVKHGHCSNFLSVLQEGNHVDFYVHPNKLFRLPSENEDVIMIGPGTGIAPFRAFLQERDAQGASGRNWLFFGDQHFTTDFLYQTEIQAYLETGVLTRFNGAFSRDQDFKVYVQHKMLQHAETFFNWLENGAHIYICGAKDPMSTDVHNALIAIISEQKGIDESQAVNYLNDLKEAGRYHVDVY